MAGAKKRPDNRPTWTKNQREEPHAGSFPLDQLKAAEEFARRITQENAFKRKYALCISYLGTNYQGLQINPGAKTVEQELEKALFLAGGIIESNYGFMNKIQWTRAARTDRGVHALTQCCAMKLLLPLDKKEDFVQQVNSFLPSDIKIQTMTKVSKGFNAKNQCTKREYHYLLPTFAFMPHNQTNDIFNKAYLAQGPILGAGYEGGYVDPNSSKCLHRESLDSIRPHFLSYRISPAQLELFQTSLKKYEGTHSYHNFTTGKDSSEANAKRFILLFTCSTPYVEENTGIEWLQLSVLGQSFLLNQIRKMVGLAIDVTRGYTSTETIDLAFGAETKMDVAMAPALGLYLNQVFFEGYNNKQMMEQRNDLKVAQNKKGQKVAKSEQQCAEEVKNEEIEKTETAEVEVEEDGREEDLDEKEDKDDKDEDQNQSRECVNWYAEEATKESLESFRREILHPHIYKQEKVSMEFFYYLDHHRAYPLAYRPKPPSAADK